MRVGRAHTFRDHRFRHFKTQEFESAPVRHEYVQFLLGNIIIVFR